MGMRERLRVPPGVAVDLASFDTQATPGGPDGKEVAAAAREAVGRELADLQERLWAQAVVEDTPCRVLLVLQGMDTSGKDGVIKRGLGGMNPTWLRITSFAAPTEEERAHHFLWRIRRALPEPGEVGVFSRSHYEDVLVVRARDLAPEEVWRPRFDEINAFERALADDGCTIVKVFLHISREYQLERQLRRLDRPDKRWKFDERDIADRVGAGEAGRRWRAEGETGWPAFQAAYEEVLERCNTPDAPWFLVPADRKWYRMWAVSQLLLETLRGLDLEFPAREDLDIPALKERLRAS